MIFLYSLICYSKIYIHCYVALKKYVDRIYEYKNYNEMYVKENIGILWEPPPWG